MINAAEYRAMASESPRVRNAYTGRVPHNTRVIRSPPDSMHCASLGYDTAHLAHLLRGFAQECLQRMKHQLYRVKVRRILGQVAETCTDSLD